MTVAWVLVISVHCFVYVDMGSRRWVFGSTSTLGSLSQIMFGHVFTKRYNLQLESSGASADITLPGEVSRTTI